MTQQRFESIGNWHDLLYRNPICSIFIFPSGIEGAGEGRGEERGKEGGRHRDFSVQGWKILSWFMKEISVYNAKKGMKKKV